MNAVSRKPPELADTTFYSIYDLWMFYSPRGQAGQKNVCKGCEEMNGAVFPGLNIRQFFPFMEIADEETIMANVHPSCICFLQRITVAHPGDTYEVQEIGYIEEW